MSLDYHKTDTVFFDASNPAKNEPMALSSGERVTRKSLVQCQTMTDGSTILYAISLYAIMHYWDIKHKYCDQITPLCASNFRILVIRGPLLPLIAFHCVIESVEIPSLRGTGE